MDLLYRDVAISEATRQTLTCELLSTITEIEAWGSTTNLASRLATLMQLRTASIRRATCLGDCEWVAW